MNGAYRLVVTPSAEREIRRLPKKDFSRINERILRLAENSRPAGCRKLAGGEGYRIRQGDYRVLYDVDDSKREVIVFAVAHRKQVYR